MAYEATGFSAALAVTRCGKGMGLFRSRRAPPGKTISAAMAAAPTTAPMMNHRLRQRFGCLTFPAA
jgi:hypothetical protein